MANGRFLALSSLVLVGLCSCTALHGKANLGEVTQITYSVDHLATIISASYGKTYLLEGNVLARYTDFDVARTHISIVKQGHLRMKSGSYDTIEIRDRTGHVHNTLQLTHEDKGDLLRFRVNDRNYLISSDKTPGSIRISPLLTT